MNMLNLTLKKITFILIFCLLSIFNYGQNAKNDYSVFDFEKGEIYSQFHPESELIEKRGQYAKHFNNDDGSVSAIVTPGTSLHYKENGVWKAIDRQIILNQTGKYPQHPYVNNKNSFASYYPSNPNGGIITEYKEGVVTDGLNKKIVWLDQNYNALSQLDFIATQASIEQNKISYTNVAPNIDLVYYQGNDGRKMDYVINSSSFLSTIPSQAKYLAFSEDFVLPKESKIDLEKNEENQTILLNVIVDNIIVFRYDLPKHYDSNGNEINSYYKVNQNTLYTIVDVDWLQSGLTFPVYIDPTTTVYPTASGNYNTGCIDNQANKTPDADIYVGMRFAYGQTSGTRRFFRAWASFDVTSIPNNATINNVVFGCYIGLNSFDSYYGEQANVSPITSGIPNTQTGGTLYNMCGENSGSDLFSIGAGFTGNTSLDITSVVSTFLTNSLSSNIFSLAFRPVGDFYTGVTEQVALYGSTRPQQTTNGKPYLTISYTVSSGPPTCTTPISPLNAATGTAHSGNLAWEAVPGATKYDVYFGLNPSPPLVSSNQAGTSYNFGSCLLPETTYYWQILPANAGGTASGCEIWSFTTGAEPPQFHNYGGTEQLTFDNSAYKADAPNFRISHPSTMEEVQIQISQDVSFPGTSVYDGNFTGSFTGENNFETSLEGESVNTSHFPQGFDYDTFTLLSGTPSAGQWSNNWWTLNNRPQMNKYETGGNPAGRVGYETEDISTWAEDWTNQIVLPNIDASGKNEIILTFDVWHSYSADDLTNCIWFETYIGAYQKNIQTVYINDIIVESIANTSGRFYFNEPRSCAKVKVIYDLSEIPENDKSDVGLKIMAKRDSKNAPFYVYFDNVSVTGETQQLTDGTTYYARARGKIGGNWTAWTTKTHSFTYKNQADIEWYQTTQPQFLTDELDGTVATANDDVIAEENSNPFQNPSFELADESDLPINWNRYGNSWVKSIRDDDYVSDGSSSLAMYIRQMDLQDFGGYDSSNDNLSVYQNNVDLTGVTELKFDLWQFYIYGYGSNAPVSFQVIIDDNSSNGNYSLGTVVYEKMSVNTEEVSYGTQTVDLTPYNFSGNKTIKLVYKVNYSDYGNYNAYIFYVDNLKVTQTQTGTITSTPFHLASIATSNPQFTELFWEQEIGGSLVLAMQHYNGTAWQNVSEFENISEPNTGSFVYDLLDMPAYDSVRVKATLTGTNAVKLFNWGIKVKENVPLPVSLLYFNVKCKDNIKILNWSTATETNNDYFIIQKSNDAKNFTDIAQVTGAGNSNRVNNYSFYDENPSAENAYYRLVQRDFDGQEKTYDPVFLHCKDGIQEFSLFPNPNKGNFQIVLTSLEEKPAKLLIYDTQGRIVFQKDLHIEKGNNWIEIELNVCMGIYSVRILDEENAYKTQKIIVN